MLSRRDVLGIGIGGLAYIAGGNVLQGMNLIKDENGPRYAAFIKFVQQMSYNELAEKIAAMGYQGIEATIRKKGYIEPEKAEEELPKLVEALKKCGLEILVMTSDMIRVDDTVSARLLKTAAGLGIKQYRMGYYYYDLKAGHKPFQDQLDEIKPVVKELAAFNKETGIQGVYQNHVGAKNVGATIWDIHYILNGIAPNEIGVAYDIRHAMGVGGDTWPITWDLMQPHLGAIFVKDCQWVDNKLENTPLGKGMVNKKFFDELKRINYQGTISVHVEYLEKAGKDENLSALENDLKVVKSWMK